MPNQSVVCSANEIHSFESVFFFFHFGSYAAYTYILPVHIYAGICTWCEFNENHIPNPNHWKKKDSRQNHDQKGVMLFAQIWRFWVFEIFFRLKYLYLWICHLIVFCLLNREKKPSDPFPRACGISMWNWLLKCLFIYSSFGITFGRTLITGWVNRFRQSARIHITLRYTYTYIHIYTLDYNRMTMTSMRIRHIFHKL